MMVDVLKGPQIDIRVEAENGTVNPQIFTIKIIFMTPEKATYFFEPSLSFVTLPSGKGVTAKGFHCRDIIMYSLNAFQSGTPITGSVQLTDDSRYRGIRYDCFLLFFDTKPPTIDEKFSLRIAGIKGGNEAIEVPSITFVRGER